MFKFLIPLFFLFSSAQALVLENLIKANKLQELLAYKKVGYYIGSFDPLHLGHQETVQIALDEGLVDYIFIYPNWGGDNYKQRIPIEQRLRMLFAVYQDNPRVIVTALPPQELQNYLTISQDDRTVAGHTVVKVAYPETKFVGIMGSDSAFKLAIPLQDSQQDKERLKHLNIFMRGVKVPEKYARHSLGGIMAIPVDSFIVAIREIDDLSPLNGKIGHRPIIEMIRTTYPLLSSTVVKKFIKEQKPIDKMVDPKVFTIIQENCLYQ